MKPTDIKDVIGIDRAYLLLACNRLGINIDQVMPHMQIEWQRCAHSDISWERRYCYGQNVLMYVRSDGTYCDSMRIDIKEYE